MKPPPFDYARAESVDEAVMLLARHEGDAKLLAGGQSLVPMLNFRLVHPSLLVDVNRIPGLSTIEEGNGALRIGALARHRELEVSVAVAERFPVLRAAVRHVAHLAIRNRGTLGGSLAHADPAAELPMMALLLDATLEVSGPAGSRRLAARDFFRSALTTTLGDAEMLTRVELPFLPPGTGWGFEEVARRAGDFALAAAAATLTLDGGTVSEARLAVMGAHDTPLRIPAAEALLAGEPASRDAMDAAARVARNAVEPYDDLHASAGFRRHLVEVLARRALESAARRARGGTGREEPGREGTGRESGRARGGCERRGGAGRAEGRRPSTHRTIRLSVNGTVFEREVEPAGFSPTSSARTSVSPAPTSAASTGSAARAPCSSTATARGPVSPSRCRRMGGGWRRWRGSGPSTSSIRSSGHSASTTRSSAGSAPRAC